MDGDGGDQIDDVGEATEQTVDFTRFLFYYRKECGHVVPSDLLQDIPFCDEPVKLSLNMFLDVLRRLFAAQGRCPTFIEDGDSLLHVAVLENMPEYAKYLITVDKVNINCQNIKGRTPLSSAIRMKRTALIDILLAANCDVNLPDSEKETPLHFAVDDSKLSLRLIQAGAEINAQNCDGDTPLHSAIRADAVETLCMLLYFNADANLPSSYDGFTPFMYATLAQNHEIQDILIDYVVDFNASAWNRLQSTILSLVLNGDGYLLQEVIDRGVDLDQSMLHNALLEAVEYGNVDVFRVIWQNFEPDETYEWSLLDLFQRLDTPENMIIVMQTILESGKLEPLFVNFDIDHLCGLLNMGDEMKVIAEQFMLIYVAQGYQLDSLIIDVMYYMTGYSEFLEILLHMDIALKPEPKPNALSNVLTHIDISMAEFKTKFILNIDSNLLRFITFDPKKVPSLVELSRDASRDYLVNTFKLLRIKDYYFLIKSLQIGAAIKDILTFKKCIYDQVETDHSYDAEAERFAIEVLNSYPWIKQVFISNPRLQS